MLYQPLPAAALLAAACLLVALTTTSSHSRCLALQRELEQEQEVRQQHTNSGTRSQSSKQVPAASVSSSGSSQQEETRDLRATMAAGAPLNQQRNNRTGASSYMNPAAAPIKSADDTDRASIIATAVAGVLIFTVGFVGNSVVIVVIMKFTKTESVTDIYILNLAFADLMFVTGLIFLATTMSLSYWAFGNLMCKLYMATTSLNQFASSLLLVVMSFDRFLAVCHPVYAQRFRRTRRAKIICLCIWIACLILMAPVFVFTKMDDTLTCGIFWPEYKTFNCEMAFTLYSFALGFSLPLLLIAAFYTCVIRKLRSAASSSSALGSARRSRGRENTNRRIEHLVIGIICTYTICWLPYWITQLCVSLLIVDERAPIVGFYQFFLLASCLSYTNSALNPILYAFLSDNFKRRFSDVLSSIYGLTLIGRRRSSGRRRNSSGAKTPPTTAPLASTNHNHNSKLPHPPDRHSACLYHHSAATATHTLALETDLDSCPADVKEPLEADPEPRPEPELEPEQLSTSSEQSMVAARVHEPA